MQNGNYGQLLQNLLQLSEQMATTPPSHVSANGTRRWKQNGLLHRDGDKPAYINLYGFRAWYKNGKLHRDGDKPAFMFNDGSLAWFRNGAEHRDNMDKPVSLDPSGWAQWNANDRRFRPGFITRFGESSVRFKFVMCALCPTF